MDVEFGDFCSSDLHDYNGVYIENETLCRLSAQLNEDPQGTQRSFLTTHTCALACKLVDRLVSSNHRLITLQPRAWRRKPQTLHFFKTRSGSTQPLGFFYMTVQRKICLMSSWSHTCQHNVQCVNEYHHVKAEGTRQAYKAENTD